MTRFRTAALLAALATGHLVQAATGQDAAGTDPRLSLAAIPAWTALGSPIDIDLRIEGAPADANVTVTVKERLQSRSAFERTLEGRSLGPTVGSVTVAVAGLQPGATGTHRVSVHVGESPPPAPDEDGLSEASVTQAPPPLPSLPVTQEGVYPLVVEVSLPEAQEASGRLLTYLVALDPAQQRAGLEVSWVWPFGVDAPRRPDGSISSGLRQAVSPEGRLAQMTTALAAVPSVPVTLAPRPATLDAWADFGAAAVTAPTSTSTPEGSADPLVVAAQALAQLRSQAASATRQVLAGTYARVSVPGLAAGGLEEEVTAQLAEGADVLRATLGIRPDPRTYLAGASLDGDALSVLRKGGVDRLVVDRQVLTPVFEQLTPARPFEIESGGRSFLSASGDPVLGELLGPPENAAERGRSDADAAQRFLAGLTVVSLEAPSEARGVVVVPPGNWRPSAALLTGVLAGLVDHPALDAVTLDAFFQEVAPAGGELASRTLELRRPGRLRLSAAAVHRARERIASVATMLPQGAAQPMDAGRRLLLAEAEPFQRRDADPSASDYLAGVDGIITSVLGAVRLPETPAVTLTAQRGRVPITLVNDFGAPLRVEVRFSSDKLLFPDGAVHDLELPPRSTTERFTVETRTSGSFPMLVEVTSPDGKLVVGSFEMNIRSTAVSGVALTITIGAGVFLVGWWGNHIRKARRVRRQDVE